MVFCMQYRVTVNGKAYDVVVELIGGSGGANVAPEVPVEPPKPEVKRSNLTPMLVEAPEHKASVQAADMGSLSGDEKVLSPFPGNIIEVSVIVGQPVTAGERLVVLEAMKMENEIVAPRDGTVKEVLVTKGTNVNTDDVLVVL